MLPQSKEENVSRHYTGVIYDFDEFHLFRLQNTNISGHTDSDRHGHAQDTYLYTFGFYLLYNY